MTPPILIFGWGNPSRGDDALGPMFVARIESLKLPQVECLTDYQLQVEHALDLAARKLVLFVDASLEATAPFDLSRLIPARESSISTHALSPEAVMRVYVELHDEEPPPCHLLAIRGEHFELGTNLSSAASAHLDMACDWAREWLVSL